MQTLEGLAVAAALVLVIIAVSWQTMPVPDRIDHGVVRRGMVVGLFFATVVGVLGAGAAFFLMARAFGSFTGW